MVEDNSPSIRRYIGCDGMHELAVEKEVDDVWEPIEPILMEFLREAEDWA